MNNSALYKVVVCAYVMLSLSVEAQLKPVPVRDITDSVKINGKPVVVLISTADCGYCYMQQKQLQNSPDILQLMTKFNYATLHAGTKENILFNKQRYRYKAQEHVHELAEYLGRDEKGRLSYPCWIVLNNKYDIIFRYQGLLAPSELKKILEKSVEIN
ncbi:thioredoxin fold domain-containing protein [Sphingobacterium spiritivorum]|uniref:thioredoxin fold domain-containing protein n=1 Tax=Sphingobacterium spiritivorum TaxID=258 RepID=UPI003DA307F8